MKNKEKEKITNVMKALRLEVDKERTYRRSE